MEEYYKFEEVQKGFYRISSQEGVFMDLFVGKEKALLFDTGYGYTDLKESIRKITNLPLEIVNSHGHLDHINGNCFFDEDVYISKKDIELFKSHSSKETRIGLVERGKAVKDIFSEEVINVLPENFDEKAYINKKTMEPKTIEEGDVFDLGGISAKVIELPGHTKGSVGLYFENEKMLYVSDAMNPFVWLFFSESEKLNVYIKTLYKVKKMDFEQIYFGHAKYPGNKKSIDDFIDCAENINAKEGVLFQPFGMKDSGTLYTRKGYKPFEFEKPGFASIVVDEKHL